MMTISTSEHFLPGTVAVVTGGGSGVGEAVARELARHGVHVILVGRTEAKLARVADAIRAAGGAADAFACDVGDRAQVQALHDAVAARFDPPQILVNAAGLHTELVPIHQTTPERWIQTFETNTVGPYLICRAFLPAMLALGWGRIINVSSAASVHEPGHIGAVYQLSKVTLNFFTRQLARELEGSGVTANAIHPGEVKTEMWAAIKADASSRSGPGRDALGWATWVEETGGDPPEKAAALVMELVSPAGDGINGQFLWIKDGLQEPRPAW
jgi:NAD(P)-dependent dehydrogenase (short-subunit alcohol dehydrogenase family)